MGKILTELSDKLKEFIEAQPVFFTGTAPADGRVNVSPKGMDSFRVLSSTQVAYLDLTGSGNETSAHLEQNGRMTIMFCSFERNPLILRLYGRGRVVRKFEPEWAQWEKEFRAIPGSRQVVVLDIDSIQTSCGFGVPLFGKAQERSTLLEWAEKKGEDGLEEYRQQKNVVSIDGLSTGWAKVSEETQ